MLDFQDLTPHQRKAALDNFNDMAASPLSSPFRKVTHASYVPIPPIALTQSTALPSLIAKHLSPLLLNYYPPLKGVVVAFSDAKMSSTKPDIVGQAPDNENPPVDAMNNLVLANCTDQDGLSFVWLTAAFCIFRPKVGDELEGEVTVISDGFVGLQLFNYFQVSVGRDCIPEGWEWINGWIAPYKDQAPNAGHRRATTEAGNFPPLDKHPHLNLDAAFLKNIPLPNDGVNHHDHTLGLAAIDEAMGAPGYYKDEMGNRVAGTLRFRVLDFDMVPGPNRESWSIQIDGTLRLKTENRTSYQVEQARRMKERAAKRAAYFAAQKGQGA